MSAADIARKAIDALNKKDLEAFKSLYASEAVSHDPMYPEPLKGKDAIGDDMASFFAAFPDAQYRISSVNDLGNDIAIGIAMTGTNTAPLKMPDGEIPATNKSVDLRMSVQSRINDQELIVEERRFYDPADMMKQLGLS